MNLMLLPGMAAEGMPDRVALGSRDAGLCYADLLAQISAAAAWIAAQPVQHVVYLGLNSPAFPIALFASAAAGRPFVPLNYRLQDADLARLLARTAPALVIADDDLLHRAGDVQGLQLVPRSAFLQRAAQRAMPADADVDANADANAAAAGQAALLLFTSGTTGEPKAAVLRHQHLTAYVLQTVEFAAAGEDEALLVSVPPYHIAGVSAVLTSVYSGRRIVQLAQFSPEQWIALAANERITHAMVVPTMLGRILDELERGGERLPALRHLSYGGGRMPLAVVERALRLLPQVDFVNAYGLTETSSTIAVLGPDDHREAFASSDPAVRGRLGSVGRPLPSVELQIRDAGDMPPPSGVPGEIWVRGEQVSGEYLGHRQIRDDGWLPTRDCGWLDHDGYLYVDGRLDDVIVRGGENISPGEIEDLLRSHTAVKDAAVIGLPDDAWGERVVAVVVAAQPVPAAELQAWVRQRLRSTKVPEQVFFRAALPFNETGKLLRRALKKELSDMTPVAPQLFEQTPEGPALIGGRRRSDGRLVFPYPQGGEAAAFEPVRLGRKGTLWSWTIQRFRPKSPPYTGPDAFVPYAVGYVELPGELIVESRLAVDDFSVLRLGLAMELTLQGFKDTEQGGSLATYAFRPSMELSSAHGAVRAGLSVTGVHQ